MVVLAVAPAACRYGTEYQLLQRYFSAARLHDLTLLHTLGTVEFVPTRHGIVRDFTVRAVSAGRERPLGPEDEPVVRIGLPSRHGGNGTEWRGVRVDRDVEIAAVLALPDGVVAERMIRVTITQVRVEAIGSGRWVVTGIDVMP